MVVKLCVRDLTKNMGERVEKGQGEENTLTGRRQLTRKPMGKRQIQSRVVNRLLGDMIRSRTFSKHAKRGEGN